MKKRHLFLGLVFSFTLSQAYAQENDDVLMVARMLASWSITVNENGTLIENLDIDDCNSISKPN